MKRIALLCLIAFAHGCCCPTEKTKEDIVELIVDKHGNKILLPLYSSSEGNLPTAQDLLNLINNPQYLSKEAQNQYSDCFFVGMTESLLPVLIKKKDSEYSLIGNKPVKYVRDLILEQNYPKLCQTLLKKFNQLFIDDYQGLYVKIGEGSRFHFWGYTINERKFTFLAPEGRQAFFIPLFPESNPNASLNGLLYENSQPRTNIKYTTMDQLSNDQLFSLNQDGKKYYPGVMFVCEASSTPFIKPQIVLLEEKEGAYLINICEHHLIEPTYIPLLVKIVFGDDDLFIY